MRHLLTTLFCSISLLLFGQGKNSIHVQINSEPFDSLPKFVITMDETDYFLDSMPYSINPSWIKKIEVLKKEEQKHIYGNGNGVVLIYPKKKYFKQIRSLLETTPNNREPIEKQTQDSISVKALKKDTIDINFGDLTLTVKSGVFFKNGLHFRETSYSLACVGKNGYIPNFRFVYNKETKTWKIIGDSHKLPEWTYKSIVIGYTTYNIWMTKATILVTNKTINWKYNNLWSIKGVSFIQKRLKHMRLIYRQAV